MRQDRDIVSARYAAWRAACVVSANDTDHAQGVLLGAELAVLRRLVAASLPTGEIGYWQIVEQEIRR